MPAAGALQQRCPHRPRFVVPASRTTKTLRPAELTQILSTGLLGGETRLELGQIPRIIFHFPDPTSCGHLSQVNTHLGVFVVWWFRVWLSTVPPNRESPSTTIRNVGLVIGGIIAMVLAIWRSIVADRQSKASQRQAETSHRQAETSHRQAETSHGQAETSERGLLNERYQKGAEMLGSKILIVRLGGIYALQRLAKEHAEQYHVQIMRLFCAFVRHPTEHKDDTAESTDANETSSTKLDRTREDVQTAMTAIGTRSDADIILEHKEKFFQTWTMRYCPVRASIKRT